MHHGSGATLVFLYVATTVAEMITVAGKVDCETVVRSVGKNRDLSRVDRKWSDYQGYSDCDI